MKEDHLGWTHSAGSAMTNCGFLKISDCLAAEKGIQKSNNENSHHTPSPSVYSKRDSKENKTNGKSTQRKMLKPTQSVHTVEDSSLQSSLHSLSGFLYLFYMVI